MSYVKDNLMPDEKVLFSARIHPAIFLPSILSFLVTFAFCVYAFSVAGRQNITSSTPSTTSLFSSMIFCITGILFFYSFLLGLQALIIMLTTEFAVTNRRVIAKMGFIRRHTLEMLLLKIESVAVQQSILGRLLNFGTVTVTGTGGTREGFKAIVEPLAARSKINQIIEHYTKAYAQQQGTLNPGGGG
ncbi:MAG: PH domain-containing protein [Anaerolineales bacterium]|nr:PH domain-containing protein [Anaerolineales bacterium]